jgi:hypothetical protein
MSPALKFHNASPNEIPEKTLVELEIEKKIAGKDKSTPTTVIKSKFFRGVFVGLSLNISPDKKRTANVPAPTANWKIAAKGASPNAYSKAVKKNVPAKAVTEYTASSRKIAKQADITSPTDRTSRIIVVHRFSDRSLGVLLLGQIYWLSLTQKALNSLWRFLGSFQRIDSRRCIGPNESMVCVCR